MVVEHVICRVSHRHRQNKQQKQIYQRNKVTCASVELQWLESTDSQDDDDDSLGGAGDGVQGHEDITPGTGVRATTEVRCLTGSE